MIWLGIGLVVAGIVLVYLSRRSADKVHYMKATETRTVKDLVSLIEELRAELGGGATGYTEYAELKGKVACDEPLIGELSEKQAAISHTRVIREYEERTETRDNEGNVTTRWTRRSETISDNRREATFYLEDETGRIEIAPKGSGLDLEKVVERFEQPTAVEQLGSGSFGLSLGSFALSLASPYSGSDRRTLGYRFIEEILPLGCNFYALGEVSDSEDGLRVRKPQDDEKKRPYLLSMKSESELVRSAETAAKWQRIIGLGFVVSGIVFAILHFV